MVDQKLLENLEYFNYLSSLIKNDARCTRQLMYRTAMSNAAFNKKKNLSSSKLGLREK
jgi:hypothetical protein